MRLRNIIRDSGTPFRERSSIAWLAELPARKQTRLSHTYPNKCITHKGKRTSW